MRLTCFHFHPKLRCAKNLALIQEGRLQLLSLTSRALTAAPVLLRFRPYAVAAVAVFILLAPVRLTGRTANVPTNPFPKPTGPFAVGMHEYLWIDQSRDEAFTKDPSDKRHLLVRVWYPAEATPGKETALYISDVNQFAEKSEYRQYANIRTNSVMDAPLAKTRDSLPILAYNHGGGTARFIGTFEAEELASHGYAVVSADHLGWAATVLFPDGYQFKADIHIAPAHADTFRDYVNTLIGWLQRDVFPEWVADAHYILDKIDELNRTASDRFHKRLDLSRIGMLGWSFGGATSIQMSKDDARVKAAIDHDGQLFYGDVTEKGTPRPFMLMHHGEPDRGPKPEDADVIKDLTARTKNHDQSLMDHSKSQWFQITIEKTQHNHFSDLSLLSPPNPGELNPHRAHEIINAYTLAFFDKYLRGRDSDLLKGHSGKYPEVAFEKKK
jgi:predicted dienelactone hydrolase